jgi:hypothetical protein
MGGEGVFSGIPIAVLTDSYKAGHFKMYPDAEKMVAVSPRFCVYYESLKFCT